MRFLTLLFVAAFFLPASAYADCTTPVAGVAGELRWLDATMKYCDGISWVFLSPITNGGSDWAGPYSSTRCKSDGEAGSDPGGYCDAGRRAIVHGGWDRLVINYDNDYDGGTYFGAVASPTASFLPNGMVGIGTTTPLSKLEVIGGNIGIGDNTGLMANLYWTSADGWKYRANGMGGGLKFLQTSEGGGAVLYVVPQNTAGAGASATPLGAVKILPNGKVGIGTATPKVSLEVVAIDDNQQIRATRTDNSTQSAGVSLWPANTISASNPAWWYGLRPNDAGLSIGTWNNSGGAGAAITRMYISTAGSVGIGNTAPAYALDVTGSIRAANVIYTSDARLKTNVRPVSGLDTILRLRGVSYDFKADGRHATGVIAQELEPVMPHAVLTAPDGVKSVDYIQIVAPLIEAVKELKADNDNLRERLGALEAGRTATPIKGQGGAAAMRLND